MERYIKDGKVAVLYSPGFGAGWSTWADQKDKNDILFDKDLVTDILFDKDLVLNNDIKGLTKLMDEKYPDVYNGGIRDLTIEWLEPGTRFLVEEYDGNESITILGPEVGYTA